MPLANPLLLITGLSAKMSGVINSTEMTSIPARTKTGAVRELVDWYRPYLRGHYVILFLSLAAGAGLLACQAVIPLIVDSLLHEGEWQSSMITLLALLIALELVLGFFGHLLARKVAEKSATSLRSHIFEKTIVSDVVREGGPPRSSIVFCQTSDVDTVAKAFESTIVEGIPGIIRVVQSLILLTVIEWRAGATMLIATLTFVALRWVVGRSMIIIDHHRHDLNRRVGEYVDESLTSYRTNARLHLDVWQVTRFRRQIHALEEATESQSLSTTQLETGANAAGLVGLLLVVVFALMYNGIGLATVAAAFLYVEGIVRGLEALPTWIRSVQLGLVSEHRIDEVLKSPNRLYIKEQESPAMPITGLAMVDLTATLATGFRLSSDSVEFPPGALIGVVTPTGTEPDHFLSLIAGSENPESGHVQLDGFDVRMPGVNDQLAYVAGESVVFNASALEQIQAVAPDMDEDSAGKLLISVGLTHLLSFPGGLTKPLGPMGSRLTANERQRLALAIALAVQPRVLLVGSILALADADAAIPVIRTIREAPSEYTLVSLHHPEVAESVDVVLFISSEGARFGTHQELLINHSDYARIWEQRLAIGGVDLSVLGIADTDQDSLHVRLVTERYGPGEVIYRQGDEADRIVFTISGQVEVRSTDNAGTDHRVALLGPGNHLGDLRLIVGERRAESAYALDHCVVRSLSREAVSAGMMGLLERTPTERRVVASILREGPTTPADLQMRLPDIEPKLLAGSLHVLMRDGALRDEGGALSVVQKRSIKPGARGLFDRLIDL